MSQWSRPNSAEREPRKIPYLRSKASADFGEWRDNRNWLYEILTRFNLARTAAPEGACAFHEPRSSGRQSAPSKTFVESQSRLTSAATVDKTLEESQSRLASAATVQGFNARIFSGNSAQERCVVRFQEDLGARLV